MSLLRFGWAAASISTWTNSATGTVLLDFSPWHTKQVVREAVPCWQFQKAADEWIQHRATEEVDSSRTAD
eukprot:7780253-Pyramimonas_sp.AAC.1